MYQPETQQSAASVDCVAFILVKGDLVLAEHRKLTKKSDPGAITVPGGHVDQGESIEKALNRELIEELGIVPSSCSYVCSLIHQSQEQQKVHYFAINSWSGNIENHEAESLLWIPVNEIERFDLEVDRIAISEYFKSVNA